MKLYTAEKAAADRSESDLLTPMRRVFYLGAAAVWAFFGLAFKAWHPRWLAVAFLVPALALFAWKHWTRDLVAMVVLLIVVLSTLALGDSTLSAALGGVGAAVALGTLSERVVRWVRGLFS